MCLQGAINGGSPSTQLVCSWVVRLYNFESHAYEMAIRVDNKSMLVYILLNSGLFW
jgi:hypothetical protein